MEFGSVMASERILFECDIDMPDRDIIDVCGGILKAEHDDLTFSCQEQSNQIDIISLVRQLSQLKEELTPSAALFSGPTLFPDPILPRSSFFPSIIPLPAPHPLLPTVVSSSSQTLESLSQNSKAHVKTFGKEDTKIAEEESLVKSPKVNGCYVQKFPSKSDSVVGNMGSTEQVTTLQTSNTSSKTELLQQPPESISSTFNHSETIPITAPTQLLTPTEPTKPQHMRKLLGRILISSPSAWSPYSKEKETLPGQTSGIKEVNGKSGLPMFYYNLTDEKSFECKYCNYQAKQYNQLARHWKTHSGERPYQCGMCDYSAALKHNLVQHMWSKHTARKKYQCSDCDYSATRRDYLAAHRTQHTGYKPYMCTQCGWETGLKSNMTQHMKRKHSTLSG